MKRLSKLVLSMTLAAGIHAGEHTCTTQWVTYKNDINIYKPPNTVKTVYITFVDGLNNVKFRTKNAESYYHYSTMIVTPEKNGVSYRASKGKELALFDNHVLLIFDGNDIVLKAICPSINLDLGEMKK